MVGILANRVTAALPKLSHQALSPTPPPPSHSPTLPPPTLSNTPSYPSHTPSLSLSLSPPSHTPYTPPLTPRSVLTPLSHTPLTHPIHTPLSHTPLTHPSHTPLTPLSLRADNQLQDIINKVVPGLAVGERKCRREFYRSRGQPEEGTTSHIRSTSHIRG